MRSPTQRSLDPGQVAALVRDSLGSEVVDPSELTGGGFAAVWRARLADGRDVVIKIGPPASVPLLEYEAGMVAAEAEYLRLVRARVPGVPTADVLLARLTGLVDGERFLYGDPLIDFVSPDLGGRIAADHPFVLGYNDVSANPVDFDDSTETRLGLYRMFLYLLMTVEMPSRAMTDAAA